MKWITILLVPMVIFSLLLNCLILWQLQNARLALQEALEGAIQGVSDLARERIEYELAIEEEIPVQANILLERPLAVPISTTIPLSTTLETSVKLTLQGVQVPLQVAIPLNLQVPLKTQVPVDVGAFPLSTTVAFQTQLPIVIEISETPLADYLSRLQRELILLRAGL